MTKIVLATRNKGKIEEIKELLNTLYPDLNVLGLDSFPHIGEIPETGETFEENALQKARTVCQMTGLISLADDSGLVVPALGGEPGVYSARYSGPDATDEKNNARLLNKMRGFKDSERYAYFVCVMAACAPDGQTLIARGKWEGQIALQPEGEHGFGYDPVFIDKESGRVAAEMTREEKNKISHRARALKELLKKWKTFYTSTLKEEVEKLGR